MNENFEALIGFICALAVLAAVWVVAGSFVASGIIETCDNYGSVVYEDVRYTCEKVEVLNEI